MSLQCGQARNLDFREHLPGQQRYEICSDMIELTRTNDPVLLSWLTFHLEDAGIDCMVFDTHTSILEGSIGAIPRRVMVLEEQKADAQRVLDRAPSREVPESEVGVADNTWVLDPEKSS